MDKNKKVKSVSKIEVNTELSSQKFFMHAAKNFTKNYEEYLRPVEDPLEKEFRRIVAVSALIQNDLCREWHVIHNSGVEDYAKISALAAAAGRMYEAKDWLFKIGTNRLADLAEHLGAKVDVRKWLKAFKLHKAWEVDGFSSVRDKVSFHYTEEILEHFQEFGKINSDRFFEIAKNFHSYVKDWMLLIRAIGEKSWRPMELVTPEVIKLYNELLSSPADPGAADHSASEPPGAQI